jgi:hypothetical protein
MTRDLALEWGSIGIRVNTVVPGPTEDTEGMRRLAPDDPEIQARMKRGVPLGRWGKIDEIADAVLFLVSPAASFITATTLVVDGGSSLISASRSLGIPGRRARRPRNSRTAPVPWLVPPDERHGNDPTVAPETVIAWSKESIPSRLPRRLD